MRRGPEKELIEDVIRERITALGGTAELFAIRGRRGAPDLLVTLPFQYMHFVECKKPKGGKLAELQRLDHQTRRRLGQEVFVVHTLEQRDAYLFEMQMRVLRYAQMTIN